MRGAQKPSFHEIGIKENQWVSVTSEIPTRAKMADLLAFFLARACARCQNSKTRRKEASVVKTRSVNPFWDKSVRGLMTGQTATGVEGA